MAGTDTAVVRLSDLQDGQEAECFAALVKRVRGTTARNQPFVKLYFRDKRVPIESPLWYDHRLYHQAGGWAEGIAYRIRAKAEVHPRFGMQLELYEVRPAQPED